MKHKAKSRYYRKFERWLIAKGHPHLSDRERNIISAIEYRRCHVLNPRLVIVDPIGVDSTTLLATYLEYWHSKYPYADTAVFAPLKGHPAAARLKKSIGAYTANKGYYEYLHGFDYQAAFVIGRDVSYDDYTDDTQESYSTIDVARAGASALAVLREDVRGILLVRTSCTRSDAPRCCLTPSQALPPKYRREDFKSSHVSKSICRREDLQSSHINKIPARREGFQPSHPRPSKQIILLILLLSPQIFLEKPLSFISKIILNLKFSVFNSSPSGPPNFKFSILNSQFSTPAPPAK